MLWALLLLASPPAAAQPSPKIPDNTIPCADFKKNDDGTWTAAKDTAFMFAGSQVKLRDGAHITATSYMYDNNRLIDALNAKCGGK
jgi:hypothetical protein